MNDALQDYESAFGGAQTGVIDPGIAVLNKLLGRGGDPIIESESVRFQDDPNERAIVIPHGMSFQEAKALFQRLHDESETQTVFDKMFLYRVPDGLNAAAKVMKQLYGVTLGLNGMFRQAAREEIEIAPGEKIMVPSGDLQIPHMEDAACHLGSTRHPEYGRVFYIHIAAKKKYENEILALFTAIEQYLETDSIYRGQAVHGADDLSFLDLNAIDRDKIVFAADVEEQLTAGVWGYLRYTDAFLEDGERLKKSTLLYGPYGTGKTSAGSLTALEAVENGWTFISADPTKDDIRDALRTARLYEPAVVFIEDVDGETSTADDDEVSSLLDVFDGMTAKGGQLMIVMTTNHVERIHKGMLRPGRLDMVIKVDQLDSDGIERLIKAHISEGQLGDVDFTEVGIAMEGFHPAFVVAAISRSRSFAINSSGGSRDYQLSTTNFVSAANSLRPQLQLLLDASEGEKQVLLDQVIRDAMRSEAQAAVHHAQLVYDDQTGNNALSVPALNGVHS